MKWGSQIGIIAKQVPSLDKETNGGRAAKTGELVGGQPGNYAFFAGTYRPAGRLKSAAAAVALGSGS